MTDLRQAATQALEALTIYSDAQCSLKGRNAITALKAALEQQAEPGACKTLCELCVKRGYDFCANAAKTTPIICPPQQQAEPPQWRDMVVVSLVREGVNKHKARELADHFAAQQQAEPDRRPLQAAGTHPAPCARHCEAKAFEIEIRSLNSRLKQQAEPVACRFCHSEGGCWTWQCYHCGEIDDVQKPTQSAPPQRPWVGLTDEEKKHLATAAGCTEDDDGHIVTEIFRLAEAKLKERNT